MAERAGEQVARADEVRLWRAVDVFRVVALLYAIYLHARQADGYRHPTGGWLVLGGLLVWTVVLLLHRRRGLPVLLADLTIAAAAILSTRLLDDAGRIQAGATTLPSIYPSAALLSWAVAGGWAYGLAAAVVICVADLVEVSFRLSAHTLNNLVLLVLTGTIVGYTSQMYRRGRADLATAVALEAATQERERLAADIHDSVLQVLAFVRKRGTEVGGEAGEIARLAGEQEERLRALVASGPARGLVDAAGSPPLDSGPAEPVDVRAELGVLSRPGVTFTGPAAPVLLPDRVARALAQAVRAAMDNVERHAGPRARTWLFLEDDGEEVVVTVRDDGVGIADGRLEAAEREGRLGVAASIRRRVAEVGGRVEVVSAPGEGTEVEMHVPRMAAG